MVENIKEGKVVKSIRMLDKCKKHQSSRKREWKQTCRETQRRDSNMKPLRKYRKISKGDTKERIHQRKRKDIKIYSLKVCYQKHREETTIIMYG